MRRHVRGQQVRILPRLRVTSVHGTAHRDEMQIVAVIHHWVDTLLARRFEVGAVYFCGLLVCLDRGLVVASANVDVRRHVHDVSRAGCKRGQFVGCRQSALRIVRGLDRMDVIVDRAQMVGVALHDRFERRYDFLGPGLGRAILMPQSPGMKIHPRLGKKRGRVRVIGKFGRNLPHSVVIILGGFSQI